MKRFLGKLQHLSTAEAEVWGQTDKSYSGAWRALPTPRVNLGKLQVPPNEDKIISVCCSRPSLHSTGRRQSRLLSLPRCWERSALPAEAAPCWLCVSNSSSSPKPRELEPLFPAGASGLRDSSAGSSTLFQPALLGWAGLAARPWEHPHPSAGNLSRLSLCRLAFQRMEPFLCCVLLQGL